MDKKLEKFRRCFLQEIPNDQTLKERLKDKIGIIKGGRLALRKSIKPYLLSAFICFFGIFFTAIIISWGNFNSIPIYKGMTANNISENVDCSCNYISNSKSSNRKNELVVKNKIVCFAHPNEEVIISIELYNPKKYAINSFCLNDKIYYQDDFLEGSTPTKILVKFLVQDFPGTQNITITNINYLANKIEKAVRFGADNVIKLRIKLEDFYNDL